VAAFRAWADSPEVARADRSAEWESAFPGWPAIQDAVYAFLRATPLAAASADDVAALLFLIARDNESETIAADVTETWSRADVIALAARARTEGEVEARWLLAKRVVDPPERELTDADRARLEDVLVAYMADPVEIVRRAALGSLAAIGSARTEAFALAEWAAEHADQVWSRMNVLAVLQYLGSTHFERLRAEAAADPREDLAAYARELGQPAT
jgi:hypothetical protein